MALSKEDLKSRYPLPAYSFRVTIGSETVSFSEVSGITLEYETLTYKHGLSFWEGEGVKRYYYSKYLPITLKKGTVHGVDFLSKWMQEKTARSLNVSLCDENGDPVMSWRVGKAIPVKLQAPTFDANTNEVAIESLELLGANISIEHH